MGSASTGVHRHSSASPVLFDAHAPILTPDANVPGLHGVSTVLPVGAKLPLSDGVHSLGPVRLVEIEYEPFSHGSAAPAPSGQYEPGSQATHVCSPPLV
eukprot:scaffold77963_cov67-Phaeocystis_antarctica.AAC.1